MMRFEYHRKLSLSLIYLLSSICFLLLPALAPASHAKASFEVYQNLQLPYPPVDMQISADGARIYVLSQNGDLMIYSTTGKLKDTIALGPGVDRIKAGPRKGILFVLNSKDNTLKVVGINIVEDIDIKGSPVKGPSSAPVTLVVFSDFQCPYCSRLVDTLEKVHQQYPQQVKIVFKHFPLRNHAWALPAARATVAADHHGKFWEFHDLLFKNYNKLNESKIEEIAASLNLDPKKLTEEMNSSQVADKVNADLNDGREAGVHGTPTVFINGVILRKLSINGFQNSISKALKELEDNGK